MPWPKPRLWPRSLLGQMLLALALALLVAQSISTVLLYRASETRRDQAILNAAAFRLVSAPQSDRQRPWREPDRNAIQGAGKRAAPFTDNGGRERAASAQGLPFSIRAERVMDFEIQPGEHRDPRLERNLREILEGQGVSARSLIVVTRPIRRDPTIQQRVRLRQRVTEAFGPDARLLVAALQVERSGTWTVARVVMPPRQGGGLRTILVQTILIFVILFGLQFLVLRRITRPLGLLTERTQHFARTQEPSEPLVQQGPDDIRRLIGAHNAMEARIGGLLSEKDVMLGAIGHDLKTPLAALRVRIESVEDERERGRMADSIEDISRSLDDILSLARVGRTNAVPERAELSALVGSVVEEFEDMGQPVTLASSTRIVHPVHVTWLRRALRNLISNALRYGGVAEVALRREGDEIVLRVEDRGPGIQEDRIDAMMEPFTRGEASRNRDTGGAGLGLTLARAIAEQHGGSLQLANRRAADGTITGLVAELRLPKD